MVRVLKRAVGIAAAVIGAIIGAGFITGAEIFEFFSGSFLLPSCFFLFVVLSFFIWAMLYAGSLHNSRDMLNMCVLGRYSKMFSAFILFFSFVTLTGMCAGLDAVMGALLGIDCKIPSLSVVGIVVSFFVCRKGIYGIEIFNLILVPTMLIVIAFACICNAPVQFHYGGSSKVFSILIYASMNCFLSSTLIVDAGIGGERKSFLPAAIISSIIVSVFVFLIMRKISATDGVDVNLPLLSSISANKLFYVIFSVISIFGIITTLVSSYYTLYTEIKKSPLKRTLNIGLGALSILFSRVGFYSIVKFAYPVMGIVGLIYSVLICIHSTKQLFSAFDDNMFK